MNIYNKKSKTMKNKNELLKCEADAGIEYLENELIFGLEPDVCDHLDQLINKHKNDKEKLNYMLIHLYELDKQNYDTYEYIDIVSKHISEL